MTFSITPKKKPRHFEVESSHATPNISANLKPKNIGDIPYPLPLPPRRSPGADHLLVKTSLAALALGPQPAELGLQSRERRHLPLVHLALLRLGGVRRGQS